LAVVKIGQQVEFKNNDPITHNLFSKSTVNEKISKELLKEESFNLSFNKVEKIKINCEVHLWESAWLIIHDNRYFAITEDDGTYKIDGIPPGKYRIKVWHERLKITDPEVQSKTIDIKSEVDEKIDWFLGLPEDK
jgi:hypothetical protein